MFKGVLETAICYIHYMYYNSWDVKRRWL